MLRIPIDSFAQNGEDVVLLRALGHIVNGHYVDVGANHPSNDSVSRAFYDRGWRGVTIEPVPEFAEMLRRDRPDDIVIEAAITSQNCESITLHEIPDTGLSTLIDATRDAHRVIGYPIRDITVKTRTLNDILSETGWNEHEIHFISIDTEGSEAEVLRSIDLRKWRPWVLVIESTAPNEDRATHLEWEESVIDAGYRFCLFDGLSRFYLAQEHGELGAALSVPANIHDNFTKQQQRELEGRLKREGELRQAANRQTILWRTIALDRWSDLMEKSSAAAARVTLENQRLQAEYEAIHATLSWRITRPLRAVRERFPRELGRAVRKRFPRDKEH
jgi:FkbM family methyltransferase